jgi:4a-hydroxytetrahydrobiopterin dehydratase
LDLLQRLKGWKLVAEATAIECTYRFDSYAAVVAFANTVAWLATKENHHPVMELHYDHCVVRYTTHAVGGLSENDFICAAKVDALLEL